MKQFLKALLWVGVFALSQIVITVVYTVLHVLFNMPSIMDMVVKDGSVDITTYVSQLLMPILIISSAVFIAAFCGYKYYTKEAFHFAWAKGPPAMCALGIGIVANVVFTAIIQAIVWVFPGLASGVESSAGLAIEGNFFVVLLGVGILGPITEELTFRYGVCGELAKNGSKSAIWISAILFGLIHGALVQGIYTCILGLLLGGLYLKTRNVWYPIFVHIGFNTTSVLVTLFPRYEFVAYVVLLGIGIAFSMLFWQNLQHECAPTFVSATVARERNH